ncbi:MAG: glycosyltransferase family 2 protein [Planctomycetes bacterium]|nr:glycosyltransferase family 2 protein [Planctomycetota bacterium]
MVEARPDCAVVVVSHRSSATLAACLGSVGDRPLVVVDSASRDGSAQVARRARPDALVLELATNEGYARAANLGVRAAPATGAVLLLNPDAVLLEGALDAMLAALARRDDAGVVGPAYLSPLGRPLLAWGEFPTPSRVLARTLRVHRRPAPARHARRVDHVTGAALLVRRRCLDALGGLDEGYFLYFEETDLCRRAATAGWEVWHEPLARVVHAVGASSSDETARRRRFAEGQARYLRRHHGGAGLDALRALWRLRELRYRLQGREAKRLAARATLAGLAG